MHELLRNAGGFALSLWPATRRPWRSTSRAASLRLRTGTGSSGARARWRAALRGALGWLECRLAGEHETGDHTLFIGEVVSVAAGHSGPALIHLGQGYTSL